MTDLRDSLQTTLGDGITIERELGGGGMSRVFLAEERSLGRKIVVKVLPPETAGDISAERFKREIQVAARLQHPHIVPLLSAGETSGVPFYTMPYVKGESLRTKLSRGGELSINETVHLMRDVAAALAYAHSEGVVHRDIKPENVMVSGGVAVVTDFGVAKAVNVAASDGGAHAPSLTSLGVALGTPAYMSPEQATADPQVDHRSDIYSFGCVAYELLCGSSPFAGRPLQRILAAHVNETPESVGKRRPQVPPALAALVMRCLEKHAGDRPQSAEEILTALDSIATTPSGGMSPTSARMPAIGRRSPRLVMFAAGAAAAIAAIVFVSARSGSSRGYTVGATTPVAVTGDLETQPAISPDGKFVAYVAWTAAGNRVFVRQIDGGRPNMLAGELNRNQVQPQWSPDGSRVTFSAGPDLYVVAAPAGGTPKRLIERAASHAWSPDGRSIAFAREGLWIRSVSDGTERELMRGGSENTQGIQTIHSPSFSPDGRYITVVDGNPPTLNNISASTIWAIPVAGGKPVRLSDSLSMNVSPVWAPDGRSVLYVSNREHGRDVYQQRVRSNGTPVGEPIRLTTSLGAYQISLSGTGGRLAYDVVRNGTNIWAVEIPATGPASMANARQITRENQHIESLSLSPDGQWLAYDSDRNGNADIFKVRVTGGEPIQLTSNAANEFAPRWSPDGRSIAYHSNRSGTRDIYVVSDEGSGEALVTSGPNEDYYPSWSPDGRSIAYTSGIGAVGVTNVVTRDASGKWSAPRALSPDSLTVWSLWSPMDSLIGTNHQTEIRVMNAKTGAATALVDVAALGGGLPLTHGWSADGSTMFVTVTRAGRSTIWAIPLRGGKPRAVLSDDANRPFGRFDFATDGKQLYFTIGQFESDVWVMELRK